MRTTFLRRVDAFLRRHTMTEREFSLQVTGSHHFLSRVKSGKGVTLTSIERAEWWMDRIDAGSSAENSIALIADTSDPPASTDSAA